MIADRAFQNLREVKEVLDDLTIEFWLDGGTLLGAWRDGEFPPGDENDVDLSTWATHKHRIPEIIQAVTARGFRLYHHWTGDKRAPGQAPEVSFVRDGLKIDLFFFETTGPDTWHLLYKRHGNEYIGTPIVVPAELVGTPSAEHSFRGTTFLVPDRTDEYLTARYGDWRTPIHRSEYQPNRDQHFKALRPDWKFWEHPPVTEVTLCAAGFERPQAMRRLIDSVKRYYPTLPVLAADCSRQPQEWPGATWITLPFDSGVSAMRNALLDRVETPLAVFVDDDMVFTPETRLDRLVEPLQQVPDLDVVAGMVQAKDGSEAHYEGLLEIIDGVLWYQQGERDRVAGWPLVDIVFNFFAARVDRLRKIRWDDDLKLAEHTDFFLRAKELPLRISYDETVRIEHPPTTAPGYGAMRARGVKYALQMFAKHGISEAVDFKGRRWSGEPTSPTPSPSRRRVRLLQPVGRRVAGDVLNTTRQQADAWLRAGLAEEA